MKRLLLVGAGHAHAHVLLDWARCAPPGCELVVLSPSPRAPYSGLLPGWLAGRLAWDDICIDFAALAAAARARFVVGEIAALDAGRQRALLADGSVIGHDVLSLNVGSTLTPPAVADPACRVLPLRPLGALRAAWEAALQHLAAHDGRRRSLAVTAVGGGAAGVEALLAVRAGLLRQAPGRAVQATLVTRGPRLLPGLAAGAARSVHAALRAAGVTVRTDTAWDDDTDTRSVDLLLWAADARAHAWQRERCGLATSADGFVRVDTRLRSVSHPWAHAAGDCAAWPQACLPKAGVHAVRMGPVLARNLRAALGDGAAVEHVPRRRVLALISTADGRAVASWGRWSARGRWVQRWKDRIDRRFVERFAVDTDGARPAAPVREDAA